LGNIQQPRILLFHLQSAKIIEIIKIKPAEWKIVEFYNEIV
jgi:hypothetical protein